MPDYQLTVTVVGKDAASGVFGKIRDALGRIGQYAGGIILARTIMGIAGAVADLAANALNAAAVFQQMQVGLEGLVARELSQLTDGAKTIAEVFPEAQIKAKGLMEELSKMAILSPYMVEAVQQVFRMNMAFGFTTDQAKKMTAGLLNYAAGIGASNEMLNRMAYNLAQINLQNKVTKLDIRQLALAGLDLVSVLRYVGDQMGLNIQDHLDFNAAIEAGEISWEQFATLFEKYAEENFSGAAERMARTLVGLKSTWHDVWVLTLPKMLGPVVEVITARLSKILDIFLKLRDLGILERWGATMASALEGVLKPLDSVLNLIERYIDQKGEMIKMSDVIEAGFGEKGVKMFTVFGKILEKVVGFFKWFAGQVKVVLQGLGVLWRGLASVWEQEGDRISAALGRIMNAIFGLGGAATEGATGLWLQGMTQLSDWISSHADDIATFFENLADWVEGDAIPALMRFRNWLAVNLPVAIGMARTAFAKFNEIRIDLQNFLDWVFSDLIPAFKIDLPTGFEVLREKLDELTGGKFTEVADTVNSVLEPIQKLIGYVTENQDSLAMFFTSLATGAGLVAGAAKGFAIAVPVIGFLVRLLMQLISSVAMAGGMAPWLAAVKAVIMSMAPVFAVAGSAIIGITTAIAILGAIVAAVVAAWTTNWAGFRDFTFALFEELRPVIEVFSSIVETVLAGAAMVAGLAWQGLMAVFQAFTNFVQNVVFPIILQLVGFFVGVFMTGVQALGAVFSWLWTAVLQPVFAWIGEYVVPVVMAVIDVIVALAKVVGAVLNVAFRVLWAIVKLVWEGFKIMAGIIWETLQPALQVIADVWNEHVKPALTTALNTVLRPMQDVFKWIADNIQKVVDWLTKLADKIKNIKLPAFLERSSPSEFEQTLVGAGEAMDALIRGPLAQLDAALMASQGVQAYIAAWRDEFIPGLRMVVEYIRNYVILTLTRLDEIMLKLRYTAEMIIFQIFPQLLSGLFRIGQVANSAATAVQRLGHALANLKIPWWLQMSSPSPLEQALHGVSLTSKGLYLTDLPKLNRALRLDEPNIMSGDTYNRTANVTVNATVANDVDMDKLARTIAYRIKNG